MMVEHHVSYFGHTEVVRALLTADSSVNLKDKHAFTALALAKQQKNIGVETLLQARGDV